jgi:hypothetical protein
MLPNPRHHLRIDGRRLSLLERKVLRYIFEAKQENGVWWKTHELYDI